MSQAILRDITAHCTRANAALAYNVRVRDYSLRFTDHELYKALAFQRNVS